jgi:hypothetical protein
VLRGVKLTRSDQGERIERVKRGLVLATIASLVLAHTASGGSTQSGAPAFGPTFSAKVIALCRRALAEKKAEPPFPFPTFNPTKPDVSKLQAIGGYEARGVQIFRTWVRGMLALGPPPRGRKQWVALLKPLSAHLRIIIDQQAAALRRDAAAFTRDYYAGNTAQSDMVRASQAAGVPVCATAAGA